MEKIGEYDPATPLGKAFCEQVTAEEFEHQGTEGTYNALQSLMAYMEEHPEEVKGIAAKKKQEVQENSGMISYLKCKLLSTIKGDDYLKDTVTRNDCREESERLQEEIQQAFNYAQEAKNNGRRFSRRIASRKAIKGNMNEVRSTPPFAPPPPPPPPPPSCPPLSGSTWSVHDDCTEKPLLAVIPKPRPPIHSTPSGRNVYKSTKNVQKSKPRWTTIVGEASSPSKLKFRKAMPFKERTNTINSDNPPLSPDNVSVTKPQLKKTESVCSRPIHDEIRAFSRNKLRSVTAGRRSPGGTPHRTPRTKRLLTASNAHELMGDYSGVSLTSLQQIIVDKFRNIRSPNDAPSPLECTLASPSGFTP